MRSHLAAAQRPTAHQRAGWMARPSARVARANLVRYGYCGRTVRLPDRPRVNQVQPCLGLTFKAARTGPDQGIAGGFNALTVRASPTMRTASCSASLGSRTHPSFLSTRCTTFPGDPLRRFRTDTPHCQPDERVSVRSRPDASAAGVSDRPRAKASLCPCALRHVRRQRPTGTFGRVHHKSRGIRHRERAWTHSAGGAGGGQGAAIS